MRFVFYTHSLVSDWNHGNAHFLRGIMRELVARGHDAEALEPEDSWSRTNLAEQQGEANVERFGRDFPELTSRTYGPGFDHAAALAEADVVVVHEWTAPALVAEIGRLRRDGGRFALLFHDTHHRAVSDHQAIAGMALEDYDAVLAFGETLRRRYEADGWGRRVFTWHEAADDRLFRPLPAEPAGDLVWIGNWGDGERTKEIGEFLIEPARTLGLSGVVHGVRYPAEGIEALRDAGLDYRGWIANADVPAAFARHRFTMHIPRRPYVEALPGIPTIRVFEALACGIPLISAPWRDEENLFRTGSDYLVAADGAEMKSRIRDVLNDPDLAASLAASGLETFRARHTCRHRVDELFAILSSLDGAQDIAREAAQ
ncbi:CgeB family protein [Aurantimonas endophytica]|uniref:Spore maturation protein CgeB n=1 Tax=Aurantimonas endophytica TaxID=1522175 RepID=A0A7W6HGA7_9HYPH|nr:glycosyltransferase [Aurantimonas endophytica]MBB4004709.1 spore maturation protein CgeB [Aurantimonas endophytica]MCO6405525.1 glycosyltransferase [Aurantimonas endophytica]